MTTAGRTIRALLAVLGPENSETPGGATPEASDEQINKSTAK